MKFYKKNLILKYIKHSLDCGSTEIQIIFKSIKILNLKNHLRYNKKDIKNKFNLKKLLFKRLKLLNYLKKKNIKCYYKLICDLNIDVVK